MKERVVAVAPTLQPGLSDCLRPAQQQRRQIRFQLAVQLESFALWQCFGRCPWGGGSQLLLPTPERAQPLLQFAAAAQVLQRGPIEDGCQACQWQRLRLFGLDQPQRHG